jgi:hypothetical protein
MVVPIGLLDHMVDQALAARQWAATKISNLNQSSDKCRWYLKRY